MCGFVARSSLCHHIRFPFRRRPTLIGWCVPGGFPVHLCRFLSPLWNQCVKYPLCVRIGDPHSGQLCVGPPVSSSRCPSRARRFLKPGKASFVQSGMGLMPRSISESCALERPHSRPSWLSDRPSRVRSLRKDVKLHRRLYRKRRVADAVGDSQSLRKARTTNYNINAAFA